MFTFNFSSDGDGDAAPPAQSLLDARELSLAEEADASAWPVETVRGCSCAQQAAGSSTEASRNTARRVAAGTAVAPCAVCGFVPLLKHVVPESRVPEMLAAGEASGRGVGELRDSLRASDLVSGGYEGGFKLWECAVDLVHEICRGHREGDSTLSFYTAPASCHIPVLVTTSGAASAKVTCSFHVPCPCVIPLPYAVHGTRRRGSSVSSVQPE